MLRDIGELLVDDITTGKTIELRDIVPYAKLIVFLHDICYRFEGEEFIAPVAIAESIDVVPLLGCTKALDRFKAVFEEKKTLLSTMKIKMSNPMGK